MKKFNEFFSFGNITFVIIALFVIYTVFLSGNSPSNPFGEPSDRQLSAEAPVQEPMYSVDPNGPEATPIESEVAEGSMSGMDILGAIAPAVAVSLGAMAFLFFFKGRRGSTAPVAAYAVPSASVAPPLPASAGAAFGQPNRISTLRHGVVIGPVKQYKSVVAAGAKMVR